MFLRDTLFIVSAQVHSQSMFARDLPQFCVVLAVRGHGTRCRLVACGPGPVNTCVLLGLHSL